MIDSRGTMATDEPPAMALGCGEELSLIGELGLIEGMEGSHLENLPGTVCNRYHWNLASERIFEVCGGEDLFPVTCQRSLRHSLFELRRNGRGTLARSNA